MQETRDKPCTEGSFCFSNLLEWSRLKSIYLSCIKTVCTQESRCIFEGIQLNLPIVRCESYSRPNFEKQPTVFSIVMQHFLVVYHGISHASLVFSRKARVYTEKIQVTSGLFHDIPRESVVYYYSTIAPFYHIILG